MSVNLFGVPYARSTDVDWFANPNKAVKRAREAKVRKIVWLRYEPDRVEPMYNSPVWQTVFTLSDFEKRHAPRFKRVGKNVWKL